MEDGVLEPYKERDKRMTDGIHPLSKMLGDVKFHEHQGIEAEAAERWRSKSEKNGDGRRLTEMNVAPRRATRLSPGNLRGLVRSRLGHATVRYHYLLPSNGYGFWTSWSQAVRPTTFR